jgi:hypothetical protein
MKSLQGHKATHAKIDDASVYLPATSLRRQEDETRLAYTVILVLDRQRRCSGLECLQMGYNLSLVAQRSSSRTGRGLRIC